MVPVSELKHINNETLVSIYRCANSWKWPPELGDKPEGWDEMPLFRQKNTPPDVITRHDILRPYLMYINSKLPECVIYPNCYHGSIQLFTDLRVAVAADIALLGVIIVMVILRFF